MRRIGKVHSLSRCTSPFSSMTAKNDVSDASTSSLSQNDIRSPRRFPPASTLRFAYLLFSTATGGETVEPGSDFHASPMRAQTVKPLAVTGCPFTVTSPLNITNRARGGWMACASVSRVSLSNVVAAEATTSANTATPSMSHALLERFAPLFTVEDAFEGCLMPKSESVCISKPCGSLCVVCVVVRRTARVRQLRGLRIERRCAAKWAA